MTKLSARDRAKIAATARLMLEAMVEAGVLDAEDKHPKET